MTVEAREAPDDPSITHVGVIGAGQMGSGIAQVCALAGFEVCLGDISAELIERAVLKIKDSLQRQVGKNQLQQDACDAAISRIHAAADLAPYRDCDLIIEAATENDAAKRKIFGDLSKILKPTAILATNTSSIPITRLAAASSVPERFIGLHFMNPVPMIKLVEIIRGIATDASVFDTAQAFVKRLGKIAVVSEDYPAFIVNRILLPMINEAIYTLYEGVGSVSSIDDAMRYGANHPMGPFQLADFIGLDTCLAIMQTLHDGLGDSKYRPCPLLIKYVEAGWLGRKTGGGFYDYRNGAPVPTK